MLPGSEALSQLLGALYDAASNPALWERFLEQLGKKTGATSAALVMNDATQRSYAVMAQWRIDPDATDLYGRYYGSVDIWGKRAAQKQENLVCVSESLCPSSELVKTEFYNGLLKPCGIEHAMFALVENTSSRLASVSLYRGSSREFLDRELEIVRLIAPHLQRAFNLHRQFSELRGRSAGCEAALDLLSAGAIFLGAEGEVVLMNRAASDIVAKRDGLLATAAGLRADRQAESDLLAQTIRQAVQGVGGASVGGTVLVSRRTRPPLQVLVSPVRSSNATLLFTPQPICAVAFVVDPSQQQRCAEDVLRTLFGLTAAECRVALLLSEGHAPKEIANMVGVTENTVRSQIKSIFSKTGVRRQSELIRLLLNDSRTVSGTSIWKRSRSDAF